MKKRPAFGLGMFLNCVINTAFLHLDKVDSLHFTFFSGVRDLRFRFPCGVDEKPLSLVDSFIIIIPII